MTFVENKKGFTLIELLFGLTIIGTLVLLATPRYLNYTSAARVIAMEEDTNILTDASGLYHSKYREWPVNELSSNVELSDLLSNLEGENNSNNFMSLSEEKLNEFIKLTRDEIDEYVIAVNGNYKGIVFHIDGKKDSNGVKHHWYEGIIPK